MGQCHSRSDVRQDSILWIPIQIPGDIQRIITGYLTFYEQVYVPLKSIFNDGMHDEEPGYEPEKPYQVFALAATKTNEIDV